MKVYAFLDGKRLVGSTKKPPHPLATINVKPCSAELNTVVAAFDKLKALGFTEFKDGYWHPSKLLRKGGVEL
jgi:hypothetical protein